MLGGPSINRDDGVIKAASLPGGRAELVFAYLAVEHARAVSRDELANALWPGVLPNSWAAALRSVVTEVRHFLDSAGLPGHELITSARGGYQMHLRPGMTLDVDDAREALAEARAATDRGDAVHAAALAWRAAALAALPFLPSHDGDWVRSVREELEAIHTAALELAARDYAAARDFRAARAAAERLVRMEPYSEAGYRLLIGVLARAGDRAGAARAYEQCRDMLRSELALEPSDETEAALREALSAAPVAAADDADPASASRRPAYGSREPGSGSRESRFASYSIVVVEDHDFQRRTALALLGRLGVGNLFEASDGSAALDVLAGIAPPDVIICDIDMPGMDGVEFIRHVARRGLASAIAIASGLDRRLLETVRAIGEGYGLQVLGTIEKPLTARALSELLATYRAPPASREREPELELSCDEIAQGLSDGNVAAQLEPIADLSQGHIGAAELIPGWRQRAGETVSRASFTAAFEVAAVADRFSEHLVELAAAARELAAGGLDGLQLATRLRYPALTDAALADKLADVAIATGVPPERLALIVRAGALGGGAAVALDVLARLRLKGFGLWLEDAAPGTQLARMPLTGVRLPGPLIAAAANDRAAAETLRDAADRARSNGCLAIGTGCTGAAEFEFLLEIGASHAQGTFVGDAKEPVELARLASTWTPPTLVTDNP